MEDTMTVLYMYSTMDVGAVGKYFFNLAKKLNVKLHQSSENSVVAHSRDVFDAFVAVCDLCVRKDDISTLEEILNNAPKGCDKFIPTFAASNLCVRAPSEDMLAWLLNRGFRMDINKVAQVASTQGRVKILNFLKIHLKQYDCWSGSSLSSPHQKTVEWLRDWWLPMWGCTVDECQNDTVRHRGYNADGLSSNDPIEQRFCTTHLKEYQQLLDARQSALDKKRAVESDIARIETNVNKKFKVELAEYKTQ